MERNAEHTVTITPEPARRPGALDGYRITCTCGETFTNSCESSAKIEAQAHVDYFARRTK